MNLEKLLRQVASGRGGMTGHGPGAGGGYGTGYRAPGYGASGYRAPGSGTSRSGGIGETIGRAIDRELANRRRGGKSSSAGGLGSLLRRFGGTRY